MIKKILTAICLTFFLSLQSFSKDVIPSYGTTLHTKTYGFYQVGKKIVLHKEPDENSRIIQEINWTSDKLTPEELPFDDVFSVFIGSKELALMAVDDETEDWVKVIYDNKNNKSGWLKKDDPYKFMTWIYFYNAYGKKYGLKILKDAPEVTEKLYSSPDETSQVVARINHPQYIKLNVIRGNWALVSVVDLDKTPKTGYMRWRSDEGVKYLFPDIK